MSVQLESELQMTGNRSDHILLNVSAYFKRHEFLTENTAVALPCLLILICATILGTFGNILIIISVLTRKNLRKVEGIFIVNLAASDLYVTLVADPMSIVAKIEGEDFFNKIPGLCQTIGSICTISCVTSLMTIAAMSFNRFIFICEHDKYERIFRKWNAICVCISFYFVGGILVLLNAANIGDHGFDRKSLECIWDRMATFPYTVVFSITLVWIPSLVTGVCYLKIFLFIRRHKKRIRELKSDTNSGMFLRRLQLARTLFIIYAVFVTCWVPYALLMVIDSNNEFPHELHIYITVFAHLHPSLNWLIYLVTNKKFSDAYKHILFKCKFCRFNKVAVDIGEVRDNGIKPFKKQGDERFSNNDIERSRQISYLTASRFEVHHNECNGSVNNSKSALVLESVC